MRKMLKDQTYAGKKRVEDSKKRRCASQRRQAHRREVRRMKRYRQTDEYKGLQLFLNVDFTSWQKALLRMIESLKDVGPRYSRMFIQNPPNFGKTSLKEYSAKFLEPQTPREVRVNEGMKVSEPVFDEAKEYFDGPATTGPWESQVDHWAESVARQRQFYRDIHSDDLYPKEHRSELEVTKRLEEAAARSIKNPDLSYLEFPAK